MHFIPSEFTIGDVYFPPMLIAGVLGFLAAWGTALLLNRYRLSRYFSYPPAVLLSMAVAYTVIIGTLIVPS
jgi:hypothetical protein